MTNLSLVPIIKMGFLPSRNAAAVDISVYLMVISSISIHNSFVEHIGMQIITDI